MSSQSLPKGVDIRRAAERLAEFEGYLPIAECPRLRAAVASEQGMIAVQLQCAVDEEGLIRLTGSLTGTVQLVCQRCLEAMAWPLEIQVAVSPVTEEGKARELPAGLEAVLMDEAGHCDLWGLVEDECLLALPSIPKHADADCSAALNDMTAQAKQVKTSAFADLKERLKRRE